MEIASLGESPKEAAIVWIADTREVWHRLASIAGGYSVGLFGAHYRCLGQTHGL